MPYIGNQHNVGDHVNNFKVLDDISSHTATFDGSATSVVSAADDTIRIPEHRFIQGQRVTYTNGGGGNIGGLTTGTAYFVSFDTANTIKLATTLANANSNTVINLSAVGSGTSHTLNVAFDGVNTKFKMTHGSGKAARLNNATQLNVAINNVIQRPNLDPNNFTDGFALQDNHKIVFKTAPTVNDVFWGSIIANTIENFDLRDNEVDNFTGDGSTTEFTLSTIPANNESVIVSINGVVQHPSDKNTARAYTLIESIIQFTAAPALGDGIQVRHIGFAGASTNDVSGFYGRTGNVALTSSDHITTGDITSRNINSSGIITATTFSGGFSGNVVGTSATFTGNLSVGGVLTYEDVTNVDSVGIITAQKDIHVGAGVSVVGIITASTIKSTNLSSGRVVFTTSGGQLEGSGNLTYDGTTLASGSPVDINSDLDVDGHTNLDNVSIVGVTTITGSGSSVLFLESSNPMIRLTDTDNSAYSSIGGESGFLYLYTNSSSRDVIFRGSQEVARITGDGLLGIGTVNPTAPIHLHKASGDITQKIESSNGAAILDLRHTNGYGYINYRQDGAETFRVGQIAQFTSYSVYNPNSSLPYQFCVEGNGEVGINTHNPADTLHLLRNSTNHGITLQRAGTNAGTAYVQVHSNGVLSLQGGNNIHYVSGGSQQHIWYRAGTEIARFNTSGSLGIGTATIRNNRTVQITGESQSNLLITGHAPSVILNADPDDSTDNDRTFLGQAAGNNNFANGSAAGDTVLRGTSSGKIHFGIGTAIKMHLTSAGDLNIGSVGRFDASGLVKSAHGTESAPSHTFLNDPDNGMYRPTTNTLGFVTGGIERLRIDSSGNIRQEKTGTNVSLTLSRNESVGTTNQALGVIDFASNTAHTVQARVMAKSLGTANVGGDLIFETRASGGSLDERFRITGDGTVGISPGGIIPTAGDLATGDSQNTPLLHVNGSGASDTSGEYNLLARFNAGNDADGSGAMIVLNHDNDRGIALQGGRSVGNRSHGAIMSVDNVGRLSNAIKIYGGNGAGVNYIALYTGESTSTQSRLHIDSSGNIGINNTDPQEKLQIAGNISLGNRGDNASRYIGKGTNGSGGVIGETSANANSSWIGFVSGSGTGQEDQIRFGTHKSGTSGGLRMVIDGIGRISAGTNGLGSHNDASEFFKIQSNTASAVLSIVGSNDTHSTLALGDEDDFNRTRLRADHTVDKLQFYVADTERLILQNGGVLSQRVGTYARLSYGILEITSGSTPSQIKITTNIPFSSAGGSHAESVTIRGFRYGGRDTVDLQICWHVYNNQFYNRIASSSGAWAPQITLGVENNKVVIHMNSLGYWPKIYVSDYYSSYLNESYAKGWSWSDAAISGDSGTPVETVPYKNDWGGLTYNDDHAIGSGHLKIHDGDLQIGTSGHGIDFSATSNGSGASSINETLDDYEFGDFTPTMYTNSNKNSTAGEDSSHTGAGQYVKVGKLVTVTVDFNNLHGNARNHVLRRITGLPFTSRSNNRTTAAIGYQRGLYFIYSTSIETTNMHHLYGHIGGSETTISLNASKGSSPYSGWPATHDSSSSQYLRITMSYFTD